MLNNLILEIAIHPYISIFIGLIICILSICYIVGIICTYRDWNVNKIYSLKTRFLIKIKVILCFFVGFFLFITLIYPANLTNINKYTHTRTIISTEYNMKIHDSEYANGFPYTTHVAYVKNKNGDFDKYSTSSNYHIQYTTKKKKVIIKYLVPNKNLSKLEMRYYNTYKDKHFDSFYKIIEYKIMN